jgi:hypothetical protein
MVQNSKFKKLFKIQNSHRDFDGQNGDPPPGSYWWFKIITGTVELEHSNSNTRTRTRTQPRTRTRTKKGFDLAVEEDCKYQSWNPAHNTLMLRFRTSSFPPTD